jgi:lipopolysaccharide export system permease protein
LLIYKYILKALVGPFIFALVTVMFLFLFQFLIKSIEQLVGKGLSIWVIIQLISLNLAWMVTLAVPMAVLVATLMAFGTLAANNEITIMKASGISLKKLMIPVLILAVILFYLMIKFNNDVLPEANHQARMLMGDISRTKPTFILESGKFSEDMGGVKIFVKKTFENSNNIEGIYVYDFANPTSRNLITAKSGDIGFTSDFKYIVMNLNDGEIHQISITDPANKYRKIEFKHHRITFSSEGFGFQRTQDNAFIRGDRELSAHDLNAKIDSVKIEQKRNNANFLKTINNDFITLSKIKFRDTIYTKTETIKNEPDKKLISIDAFNNYDSVYIIYKKFVMSKELYTGQLIYNTQVEKQIDIYDVEVYKKYSIPFACVVFALIGAPLGYKVRRGGFGIAAGFSLLFFLIYWVALMGGEKLADRALFSPFLGMWIVNIILGLFGLYLMFKSS